MYFCVSRLSPQVPSSEIYLRYVGQGWLSFANLSPVVGQHNPKQKDFHNLSPICSALGILKESEYVPVLGAYPLVISTEWMPIWDQFKYFVISSKSFNMQQWILEGTRGFDDLRIVERPIPVATGNDVLVKFHAASLNYRDVMIAKVNSLILTSPALTFYTGNVLLAQQTRSYSRVRNCPLIFY